MQPGFPLRGLRRSSRFQNRATTPPNPQLQLIPPPDMAESSAEYIGQMAAELASLAKSAHLDMLHYLLNMARLEAESHSFKENR